MTGFLDSLLDDYQLYLERHRNRAFLKGAMAACALVASADGDVRFSERIRVDQVLDTLEQLKVFDPHEGIELFNAYVARILQSPREGRELTLDDVKTACQSDEDAIKIVRICQAVAGAGGKAGFEAQSETVMLCSLLDVPPERVGLRLADCCYTGESQEDECH